MPFFQANLLKRGGAAGVGWTDCGMAFISSVSIVCIGFNFHLRVQRLPFRIKRSSKWNSQITELAEGFQPSRQTNFSHAGNR